MNHLEQLRTTSSSNLRRSFYFNFNLSPLLSLLVLSTLALLFFSCTKEEVEETGKILKEKGEAGFEMAKEKGKEGYEKGSQLAKVGYEAAKDRGEKSYKIAKREGGKGYEAAKDRGEKSYKIAKREGGKLIEGGYEAAKDTTSTAAANARAKGGELAKDGYEKASAASGELSESTLHWLADKTGVSPEGITGMISKAKQVTGVALEIGKTLNKSIDSNTEIEPIYQSVEDTEALDKAIKGMPHTQVIDDLQIGFEEMSGYENATRRSKDGFLVLWRRNQHLIGFVFRSKRDIDFAQIAKEAPRLIRLINSTIN